MDASEIAPAVAACRAVAAANGLGVDDAVVLHDSNRWPELGGFLDGSCRDSRPEPLVERAAHRV